MKWLLLAVLLASSNAFGALEKSLYVSADWESLKAKSLSSAQSRAKQAVELENIDRLKILGQLCDEQLNSGRIPISCFELLEREKLAALISGRVLKENRARIDAVCVRALTAIRRLDDSQTRLRLPASKCKDALAAHLEKLRYGAEFRRPTDVFSERHRF
ncbi:MAG: hypothetical protein ABL958_00055 [Bdellovibrionia bacterium]